MLAPPPICSDGDFAVKASTTALLSVSQLSGPSECFATAVTSAEVAPSPRLALDLTKNHESPKAITWCNDSRAGRPHRNTESLKTSPDAPLSAANLDCDVPNRRSLAFIALAKPRRVVQAKITDHESAEYGVHAGSKISFGSDSGSADQ